MAPYARELWADLGWQGGGGGCQRGPNPLSNILEAFKVSVSKFKSVLRNEQNGFVPIHGQINI